MGLWHTHRSPNLGQKTRPYNNQQKKKKKEKLQNCRLAVPADHRIKLEDCEKKDEYVDLARELKKKQNKQTIEHEGDDCTNCNWCFWHSWRTWKLADEWRPSKQRHNWKRPEYWEESWTLKEICCPSKSSEKPSANADVKNSKGVNNNKKGIF